MQKVNGRVCAAKAIHFESFDRDDRMVFFVDRATKQMLGWDQVFGDTKMHFRFENLRFDIKVPVGAFDWKPSPELKEKIIKRDHSVSEKYVTQLLMRLLDVGHQKNQGTRRDLGGRLIAMKCGTMSDSLRAALKLHLIHSGLC